MNVCSLSRRLVRFSALALAFVTIAPCSARSQTVPKAHDAQGFFHGLSGDWIGAVKQSTNGVRVPTKYFHASIKQTAADTYSAVFEYYRVDERTHAAVSTGVATMTNVLGRDGTVTNTIVGSGDVLVDPKTLRREDHQLFEVLRMSVPGCLEGRGSGRINVSGIALNAGKNGKVSDYTSSWALDNGVLSITERLKVTFRVFLFSKHYDIVDSFEAQRGTDINGLVKAAAGVATR